MVSIKSSVVSPILLIAIVVQSFLLINGNVIFGSSWNSYSEALTIYILLDALFLALSFTKILPFIEISISDAIIVFVPTFIVGGFAFQSLFRLSPISVPLNSFILDFLFQVMVVSFTEEMLFRGILLQYKLGPLPGWLWQGIAFGLFHWTSYTTPTGLDVVALIIAMFLGVVFGLIVYYFTQLKLSGVGLTITWALHAAWNISITTTIFSLTIFGISGNSLMYILTFVSLIVLLFLVVKSKNIFRRFERKKTSYTSI